MALGKLYDKFTKFLKLTTLWFIRILCAPSHFKVSIFKRIYYAINGGFTVDQVGLYKLNHKNKKEYLSEFDWYKSRYINEPYNFILNNKLVATDLLSQYIRVPKVVCIKKSGVIYSSDGKVKNADDIIKVLKKDKKLYIKPINRGKGFGVNRLEYRNKKFIADELIMSSEELVDFLAVRDNWFICECINQAKFLDEIYDKTSNTIRLITVRNPESLEVEILCAVQRIGTKETIPVDNGSRGGLVANIDLETGELSEARSIQKECNYTNHPDSNNRIKGVVIPDWGKLKSEVISLMEKFPYLYFVAWDILITDEGPVVIETNTSSGVNIIQLWGGQRNDKLGEFYKAHKIIRK